MKTMSFARAIESAVKLSMEEDENIIVFGEDVHTIRANLFAQFGEKRIKSTPISESAFIGAAVTAAMAGLHPIVEILLVDFVAVAMDAILNHAAKNFFFSGEKWNVPLVIRVSCGGGYGDAGQHEQSLWGWLAHIPGIKVVVPSNPSDAGRLMISAIKDKHPVVYLEHKLLADYWLDSMGSGGRKTVSFDVPSAGAEGLVPDEWNELPIGKLNCIRLGTDISIASIGVGVHKSLEAAKKLEKLGISAEILDLRWISPLDKEGLINSVEKTGSIVVVDEDYKSFGLSGEICAILKEEGLNFKYGRVCTENTIPYSRIMEKKMLPSANTITEMAKNILK